MAKIPANGGLYFTKEQWKQLFGEMAKRIKNEIDIEPSESRDAATPTMARADVSVDTDKQIITVQPEDTSKPIEIGYEEKTEGDTSTLILTYPDGANFKVEVK